jgi:hypothetical protein
MTGMVTVLQGWLADAEALAGRVPDAAQRLAAGSWPAIALATALGLALLVAGARLRRVLSGAAAGLVGFVLGTTLARLVGGPVGPSTWAWAVAAILTVGAALAPGIYPSALGALAGGVLGARLPVGGSAALGAALGAVVGGSVALLLRRLVLAATAAAAGASLLATVLLALGARYPALAVLGARPVVLVAIGALLFVAGTAFQVGAGDGGGRSGKARGAGNSRTRLPLED